MTEEVRCRFGYDVSPYRRCEQHYIAFMSSVPSPYAACHETGHAVGLMHGSEASPQVALDNPYLGCMRTPELVGPYYTLSVHQRIQINQTY